MNTRTHSADSRERIHAYDVSIDVQDKIIDDMTDMMLSMRVTGKNTMLPFQKGINYL